MRGLTACGAFPGCGVGVGGPQLFAWMEGTEMRVLRGHDGKSSQGRENYMERDLECSAGSLWNLQLDTDSVHM